MKESMNFTQFKESMCDPLYEADGTPKCPEGYKWDMKTMQCVPKTKKDKVDGDQGQSNGTPETYDGYNVWGSNGMDGGYALAVERKIYDEKTEKELDAEEDKARHKKLQMKYGKSEKPTSLRPGEVRRWDPEKKRYVSNMEEGYEPYPIDNVLKQIRKKRKEGSKYDDDIEQMKSVAREMGHQIDEPSGINPNTPSKKQR